MAIEDNINPFPRGDKNPQDVMGGFGSKSQQMGKDTSVDSGRSIGKDTSNNKTAQLGIKARLKDVDAEKIESIKLIFKWFIYLIVGVITLLLMVFFLSVLFLDIDYRKTSTFYYEYIPLLARYIGTYGSMSLTLSLFLLIISGNLLRIGYLILAMVFIADVMMFSILFAPYIVGFLQVYQQNLETNNILGKLLIRFFGCYWLVKDNIVVSIIAPITILIANGFYLSYIYQKWWQERNKYDIVDCVLVSYPIKFNRLTTGIVTDLKKKTYQKFQQITENRRKLAENNKTLMLEDKKNHSNPITEKPKEFVKKPDELEKKGLIPSSIDVVNTNNSKQNTSLRNEVKEDKPIVKEKPLVDIAADNEIIKRSEQIREIVQDKRSKKISVVNNEIMLNLGTRFVDEPINIKLEGHKTIMGMTGMGKSKLMLYLIGQMIQYSPNEIQLILMCGKEGLVFKHFLHLPHILKLSKNKKDFTETVDLVCKEQKKRFQILDEYSLENIGQYNKLCTPSNRIPYIIFIIDEASYVFSSDNYDKTAIERLTAEISTMRAAGIFMIFGAQNPGADVIPKNVRANTPHSIVVPCKNAQMSISACGIAGGETLNSETYEAMIVSPEIRTAGDKVVFNRAYVDEDSILELVKQSETKYGFNEELKKIHTDSLKKRELLSQQITQPIDEPIDEGVKKLQYTTKETVDNAKENVAKTETTETTETKEDDNESNHKIANKKTQDEILLLHSQGESARNIAAKLNSNYSAIQRTLVNMKKNIEQLRVAKLKNTEICEKLGIRLKTLIAYYQYSEKLENQI